jgi:hypothetical protein
MLLLDGMSQFLWEKWTLNTWGWNVAMGQNVTQLGWPNMFGRNVQLWHFAPKKCSKRYLCSGVDEQSVHLETKCHSGRSEHWDIMLGGRFEGVETLLGRSVRGRFVKAPLDRGIFYVSRSIDLLAPLCAKGHSINVRAYQRNAYSISCWRRIRWRYSCSV